MTQEALKLALECAKRCEAIDGMYSVCYTYSGSLVHLPAWTEVTIEEDK